MAGFSLTATGGPACLQVSVQCGHCAGFATADPLLGISDRTGCDFQQLPVRGQCKFAEEKIPFWPLIIGSARPPFGQAFIRQRLEPQCGDALGQFGELKIIDVVLAGVATGKYGLIFLQLQPADAGFRFCRGDCTP